MIECGDGRWRMVVVNTATNLIVRSHVIADPVENGWTEEDPSHVGQAEEIPIGHCDESYIPFDYAV